MKPIMGTAGLSVGDIRLGVGEGARFVIYQYCVSIGIMSFKRSSSIHFIREGERKWGLALGMSSISLVAGWWGIPWGPIWTVGTIFNNLGGGKDLTEEVLHALNEVPNEVRIPASGQTANLRGVFD